ncbi:hypothetical protein ASC87_00510 [Rhizobacter sp. Root1221]|nr:hypothetical protein ASC87_00510 [Rhizobacter sp. Root1221]
MRDAAREDLAAACCRFGLSKELLERISMLTHTEVLSLVAHVGEEPLFVPRGDLTNLLSAHPTVLPVLATLPKRHAGHTAAAN